MEQVVRLHIIGLAFSRLWRDASHQLGDGNPCEVANIRAEAHEITQAH